jgi:3-hydroxyisobutyrate dehydrogenase-like beta-hydroxyacid dehydrogenase
VADEDAGRSYEMTKIAFLGIGSMGHGMATSALRARIPTILWNRGPEATRDLAERGAEVAETAADAARRAEIVVTMVTDTDAVISIPGPGHARWARSGRDLGADEHDRRGRDRARRGHGGCRAS